VLCKQTPPTNAFNWVLRYSSPHCANQCRESLLPLMSWGPFLEGPEKFSHPKNFLGLSRNRALVNRISKKPLCFAMRSRRWRLRDNFSVARFYLKLGHSGKMGKTKKDTNARVAGWRKQIKESVAEQLYMVSCAWIIFQWVLMRPNDSSLSDSSASLSTSQLLLSSSQIFT